MSRDLTTPLANQLKAAGFRPVVFVEADYPSGPVRLWTGVGEITWDSKTWTGAGNLLAIAAIQESGQPVANALQITISGIPSAYISNALTESRLGRSVKLWLGAQGDAGAIVADPYLAFSGSLDVPVVTDSGQACSIEVTVESDLEDLQRPRIRRYTHQDQQVTHPMDLFFVFVDSIQNWNGAWGHLNSGQKATYTGNNPWAGGIVALHNLNP